jgi:hypothetical protein
MLSIEGFSNYLYLVYWGLRCPKFFLCGPVDSYKTIFLPTFLYPSTTASFSNCTDSFSHHYNFLVVMQVTDGLKNSGGGKKYGEKLSFNIGTDYKQS